MTELKEIPSYFSDYKMGKRAEDMTRHFGETNHPYTICPSCGDAVQHYITNPEIWCTCGTSFLNPYVFKKRSDIGNCKEIW
jgi:predicted nucleic acid-binding Zn ribbon protein